MSISTFLVVMAATMFKIPVSSTITVIFATQGAAMASGELGVDSTDLGEQLFWVIAAFLVSVILSFVLMILLTQNTMNMKESSYSRRLTVLCLISGLCSTICFIVVDRVIQRWISGFVWFGHTNHESSHSYDSTPLRWCCVVIGGFAFGFILCRIILVRNLLSM